MQITFLMRKYPPAGTKLHYDVHVAAENSLVVLVTNCDDIICGISAFEKWFPWQQESSCVKAKTICKAVITPNSFIIKN